MKVTPYLNFNGDCEAALKFYEQSLGGKITFKMPYAGSPMESHVPADRLDKILHATLQLGDTIVGAADAPPDRYEKPRGFAVTLNLKDTAEAERIFQALAEGGSVQLPIQETFWAARFGMVVDRFGTPWMINCEKQT